MALISLLSVESLFYCPYDKRDEATAAKKRFLHYEGDHLTLLRLFKTFRKVGRDNRQQWCHDHFINYRSMKHVMDIHRHLLGFLTGWRISLTPNDRVSTTYDNDAICHSDTMPRYNDDNDTVSLRKCILAGFFHHIAMLRDDGTYKTLMTKQVRELVCGEGHL